MLALAEEYNRWMRWLLVALLFSPPALAAGDDDEQPPRYSPKQAEERALGRKARIEAIVGKIVWPIGLALTGGGFVLVGLRTFGFQTFDRYFETQNPAYPNCGDCTVETTTGKALPIAGTTLVVVGFVTFAVGLAVSLAARTHRVQANPWLARLPDIAAFR
jgi:hypothetical protein